MSVCLIDTLLTFISGYGVCWFFVYKITIFHIESDTYLGEIISHHADNIQFLLKACPFILAHWWVLSATVSIVFCLMWNLFF